MQNPVSECHHGHNGLLLIMDARHAFSNTFQCISDCKDKINLLNQNKNHGKIYIFYEKECILEQTGVNINPFLHFIACFIQSPGIHNDTQRKQTSTKQHLLTQQESKTLHFNTPTKTSKSAKSMFQPSRHAWPKLFATMHKAHA